MIKIGCLARFNNLYENEVEFARENRFELMQVWYDRNGIRNQEIQENRIDKIAKFKFPTIIHAVLDINEVEEHIPKLIKILTALQQKELIIHPICHSEKINENTIQKLSTIIHGALITLKEYDITLFLENNSKLDPIFSSSKEIALMFSQNPELEFLLDIAHVDDYKHLKDMVSIRMPKKLHVTDSHFDVIHEHIPLGEGDIDFQYIFKEILPDFDGDIIIELLEDKDIIKAKKIIKNCLE
ncbi:sugar phosphate isomerase/epimerase [Clostridium sp. 19966]|uniref:TIM barrel protein n=1 Tax=Clostridium sp. 19966 TaxID=2768166 RepID=UPI0028DF57B2|nr:TIM barrel protein [Clostridium sp. 19966]MDT8717677.1 sugar phosphate isomerase/epimerase [Clostridium sp. 19966]